jgi:hypothetical protein
MATQVFIFGYRRFYLALLLATLCAILLPGAHFEISAQSGPKSNEQQLLNSGQRILDFTKEFDDFVKTGDTAFENGKLDDLRNLATNTSESLNKAASLVGIYEDLECEQDRVKVRPRIEANLRDYGKSLGLAIETANRRISNTRNPDVVGVAVRMRNDLRDAKTLLDSIKLR